MSGGKLIAARMEADAILRLWATTSPTALSRPGAERVFCSWSADDARRSVNLYLARIGCTRQERRMLRDWHRAEYHAGGASDTDHFAQLRAQVLDEVVSWVLAEWADSPAKTKAGGEVNPSGFRASLEE